MARGWRWLYLIGFEVARSSSSQSPKVLRWYVGTTTDRAKRRAQHETGEIAWTATGRVETFEFHSVSLGLITEREALISELRSKK